MYQHLPASLKKNIHELALGEAQVNIVSRDYYKDDSFCRSNNGEISLWKLYNLFTFVNRNSYIDSFLDRAVSATTFAHQLAGALEHKSTNWFLG
jgi:hypothetical protein